MFINNSAKKNIWLRKKKNHLGEFDSLTKKRWNFYPQFESTARKEPGLGAQGLGHSGQGHPGKQKYTHVYTQNPEAFII